jgi:GTP-binding protein
MNCNPFLTQRADTTKVSGSMRLLVILPTLLLVLGLLTPMIALRAVRIFQVSAKRLGVVRHCTTETAASFEEVIQHYKKLKAPKRILSTVEEYSLSHQLTPCFVFTAMKAIVNLDRHDLLPNMLPFCISAISEEAVQQQREVHAVISMIRLYSKLEVLDAAEKVVEHTEAVTSGKDQLAAFQQSALPELTLAYIKSGAVFKAQSCLEKLHQLGATLESDVAKGILKQFLMVGRPGTILKALQTLLQLNDLNDHESIQMITNYYLRNVEFMKGVVNLTTAPVASCPEVCFIGRSNVGKSSLINMICNRKSLAYSSKTPGKTTEYNYFEAKGAVGALKEAHRFYLVDLPGVGFAKKDKAMRKGWSAFLRDYVTQRDSLRVVYHLVDARHGLMDADEECLSLLEVLPAHVQYVIVLTKADKQGSGEKGSSLLSDVMSSVEGAVRERTERHVPVIMTSSQTKRGGVQLLSHLLQAVAEPSTPS